MQCLIENKNMENYNFYISVFILLLLLKNEFRNISFSNFRKKKKQSKKQVIKKKLDDQPFEVGQNVFDELAGAPGVITSIQIYNIAGQLIPHYSVKLKNGVSNVHDAATIRKLNQEDLEWL